MIQALYEAHLAVSSLERSITFYRDVLGLQLALLDESRRIAFLWVGKPKEFMLGLWEKPQPEIRSNHIAFRCSIEDVLHKSTQFLNERGLEPYNFLRDGTRRPMVFAWMPAVAIYFKDPDGHELEFIAILEGEGRPELGVISYEAWLSR